MQRWLVAWAVALGGDADRGAVAGLAFGEEKGGAAPVLACRDGGGGHFGHLAARVIGGAVEAVAGEGTNPR